MTDEIARVSRGYVASIHEHPEIIAADLAIIRREMPAVRRVLDVGAGPATFVRRAIDLGYDAHAIDIGAGAAPVWRSRQISGILGDGFRLPFRDRVFDLVRLKEVIEHVSDPLALVVESLRVLGSGGHIIAHVPSPYSQFYPVANFWDDYTHVRPLTRRGIKRLFDDAGTDQVRIHGYAAGRNAIERAVASVVGRVVPHTYRVIAYKI